MQRKKQYNIKISIYYSHKDNWAIYKCKKCNAKSYKAITPLKEKFRNVWELVNKDTDKYLLLLRKGAYPYDYMNSWERFNENMLPLKKEFYKKLDQKDISDEDYAHA